MIEIKDLNELVKLAADNGITSNVTEGPVIAKIDPKLLPDPIMVIVKGYPKTKFQGNGWSLNLATGVNPMKIAGDIHVLQGKKKDDQGVETEWKMLIIR
jgi:hypothetical protein